jgi:hypothetical protein
VNPSILIARLSMPMLAAIVAAHLSPAARGQDQTDPAQWQRATDLARRILVIDVHSHDLYKPVSAVCPKQVTIPMLSKGGLSGNFVRLLERVEQAAGAAR